MQRSRDPKPGQSKPGYKRKTALTQMFSQGHTGVFPFLQYPHKAETAVTLSNHQRSLGFPLAMPAANSSRVHALSFSSLLNHPLMFGHASSHGQVCASISASKSFLNKTNGAFSSQFKHNSRSQSTISLCYEMLPSCSQADFFKHICPLQTP